MGKLVCSAQILDSKERESIMDWIRRMKCESFSEIGSTVHLCYRIDSSNSDSTAQKWSIIHTFEKYPTHSIEEVS